MLSIDLADKRAIVCGSTQGIGWGVAQALASAGAHVTMVARNEVVLRQRIGELGQNGKQKHEFVVADFSDNEGFKKIISSFAKSIQGAVDILVNNTGGPPAGKAIDATEEAYLAAFSAHLLCNQFLVQQFVPHMKQEGYGRIINIISLSVKTPIPGLGVSNTIRGAVASWAKTLAGELAPYGITVNNVLPGFINTGRLSSLIKTRASIAGISIEEQEKKMISTIPAGKLGTIEDMGNTVAFLASPLAAYVNGINFPVDGGRTPSL